MLPNAGSTLRTDLFGAADLQNPDPKIIVEKIYDMYLERSIQDERLKTIGPSKDLPDTVDIIRKAIEDYESRGNTVNNTRINFSYNEPNKVLELDAITVEPTLTLPGMFAKGRPTKSESTTRELKKHLREIVDDPDNNGYKLLVFGQYFDNFVDFTCWSATNKEALDRAIWFENIMEEYLWLFTMSGVHSIIYQGRKNRKVKSVGDDNLIYGYPVEFFIRTEKITRISEKTLEKMVINLGITTS